ncbi:MAG: single-stranded DNA-binding protein [Methylocella sp.]
MTAHALMPGQLFREPERRTSKTGKPFVTAARDAKDGEAFQFWNVVAFQENIQAGLMWLTGGDALSVQGAFKVGTYEKDGATRLSLSIVADRVLALRQPSCKNADAGKIVRQGTPFDDPLLRRRCACGVKGLPGHGGVAWLRSLAALGGWRDHA